MSSQISKIIQDDNARGMKQRFRFISAKIPLMGMGKKSHHFLRSLLERGVSLNSIFFYNHPTFRRKVGVAFAFLFPLEVGVGESIVDLVVEFASLSRVSF